MSLTPSSVLTPPCGVASNAALQFTGSVGIITPYREQITELKAQLRAEFPGLADNLANTAEVGMTLSLQVNTVDGFQGQEKDIIIGVCLCMYVCVCLCRMGAGV